MATLAHCRGCLCAQQITSLLAAFRPELPWLNPLSLDAKASINTKKETQCLLAKTLHNNALDLSLILFHELQP